MSKFKHNDRVLPMKPKQKIVLAKMRTFKFIERLKILFGCNLRIEVVLLTEHGPGRVMEKMNIELTHNSTKEDELRDQVVG